MNLINQGNTLYDPFKKIYSGDRLLGLTLIPGSIRSEHEQDWCPAVDVSENKDSFTVRADLPGLQQEDIHVSLEDAVLTIQGERKSESEEKENSFYRVERSCGIFRRSIDLGRQLDATKIKASYRNGVLEIVLPKSEQVKPQQIKVDVQ